MTLYPIPTFADNDLWMLRVGPEADAASPGAITPAREPFKSWGFGWPAF
ncbi:MAG: hypothetical protein ABIX12_10235 [Rubrivivax sp.]